MAGQEVGGVAADLSRYGRERARYLLGASSAWPAPFGRGSNEVTSSGASASRIDFEKSLAKP